MWHYVKNNKANGPIKIIEIEALIKKNEIKRDTKVWREGMSDWQNAMDTELQSRFPQNIPNDQPRKSKPKKQPTAVDDHSNRNPKKQTIDMNQNREIIDYMIASNNDVEHLEKDIKTYYLKDGWQPLGGICHDAINRNCPEFHQVLVKYATQK
jgi:hypothetical protein